MTRRATIEVPIRGMDCADCARHVQRAIAAVPGVISVEVRLAAEQAVVEMDASRADLAAVRRAVGAAGYSVPLPEAPSPAGSLGGKVSRQVLTLLGILFGTVLFVVVLGEWLGLFTTLTGRVPWPLWLGVVVFGGFPVFRKVVLAARRRQVIAHTLMTVGVAAAVAVSEWPTAAVVVLFMRVGDYAEWFTTDRARRAVRSLAALAPQRARVERDGVDVDIPADAVRRGDIVVVRPGESLPVDGEVISGEATLDQAAITGESAPVEVGPGSRVFAATLVRAGSIRVRATHVGRESTFGRVIRLVEEAEAHRAEVQRAADRFAGYYLPVVAAVAALTVLFRRDPLAAAAVLVVACSCSFALATPIAVLASIGAGARRGLLIKGGRYLEALARADVVLIDKTGTLTLGRPQITDIVPLNGATPEEVLALAATAERYSEHPLAAAVRDAAQKRRITPGHPEQFEALPGVGVQARIDGHRITVRSGRTAPGVPRPPVLEAIEAAGRTAMLVTRDEQLIGVLAAADTMRPEVPAALRALRGLGIRQVELLTGDTDEAARVLAERLGIPYRARLMPEDKIAVVKDYQARGRTVIMIGDGINDAPALAQADVGIAMGVAGTELALEAAHIGLMRDDWMLVPAVFRIARRTMGVVKLNIAFTAVYNLVGLSLAALGYLPPIFAAAVQSLPDLGILANSSRLLRQG
ncbi:MAG: cation-translocating P-type ATPase [Armatimonadota bacterium]|nr:cation-translocating P-type ATPase [Armatimonadota bacterium]